MEFSNLYFIYIWLPFLLLTYFLVRGMRWKNYVLAGFSLFFYAMGQPVYLALLVGLTYANFHLASGIRPGEKATLWKPVAMNLAVLAVFKYLDFFLSLFGIAAADGLLLGILKWLIRGLNTIGFAFREPSTIVPMGISFFTFSMISYLVDVYREKVDPEPSFKRMLMYVCLFPKILQGPIVRYEQIVFQLGHRYANPRMVFEGAFRFAVGLSKKVLLADYCGKAIADLAAMNCDTSFVGSWLSAVLFMFQIYFDFSGCSDMAIGLGRLFGFDFCENFDLPYVSRSITEFWRRWHMSLGSFFRDYVYIPLGGNRLGFRRQVVNLLVVWSLTGLWHGASWNYVLWGLYFFGLLVAEKYYKDEIERIPAAARHAVTLLLLLIGWVIFSHEDFRSLGTALGGMLGLGGFAAPGVWLKLLNTLPLMVACGVSCTSLPRQCVDSWKMLCGIHDDDDDTATPWKVAYMVSVFLLMLLLLWLCTVSLIGNTSAPSIYGNF